MKYRIKYRSKNDSYFIEKKGWIFWKEAGNFNGYYYATLEEAKQAMMRMREYDKACKIKDKVVYELKEDDEI